MLRGTTTVMRWCGSSSGRLQCWGSSARWSGITQALGDLDPKILATAIQTAMEGLLAGLYVAFDTTALALSLSILLMFFQFFVDRVESQLLTVVDARGERGAGWLLSSRLGRRPDPHLLSVQHMAREVMEASENLVHRQTEIWQQAAFGCRAAVGGCHTRLGPARAAAAGAGPG